MSNILSPKLNTGKFSLPEIIDSDRRKTLMSYAASLRAYGAEEEEIHNALLKANAERCQPPLSSYQDLKGLARMAKWAAKRAKATRRRTITETDAQRLIDAEHALECHLWRGIAARNAQLVARALIAKMWDDKTASDCVGDVRTLAKATALSRPTVSRALRKLSGLKQDNRILVICSRQVNRTVKKYDDGRDPVQYAFSYAIRLNFRRCKNETHHLSLNKNVESTCLKTAPSTLHDAFRVRGKGLTKSAALVYDSLPAKTQKDVQKVTNLSLRTIKSAMAALVREGLIEKKDNLWIRTSESLDAVAVRRGTVGASQRQHDQHQDDRQKYRARLREKPGRKLKVVKKFGGEVPVRGMIPDADYAGFPDTDIEFSVPGTGRVEKQKERREVVVNGAHPLVSTY